MGGFLEISSGGTPSSVVNINSAASVVGTPNAEFVEQQQMAVHPSFYAHLQQQQYGANMTVMVEGGGQHFDVKR